MQVSNDAEKWHDVYEEKDSKGGEIAVALAQQQARYVRVEGFERASEWGYSLIEIEVYNRDKNTPQLTPVHFIRLALTDMAGNLLSDNFYWRSVERGNYQALNSLAPAKLKTQTQLIKSGDKNIIRATVKNVGRSVAFAVHMQPYRQSDGERILPIFSDDNYITLMPGESRTLDFEFDADLLPDGKYTFKTEAYNR